ARAGRRGYGRRLSKAGVGLRTTLPRGTTRARLPASRKTATREVVFLRISLVAEGKVMQSYVDQLMRIIGYLGIFAGGIGACVLLLWFAVFSLEKGLRYLGALNGIAQWIWRREAFNEWLENSPQISNTVAGKLGRLADYERRLDEIAERATFCVYIY